MLLASSTTNWPKSSTYLLVHIKTGVGGLLLTESLLLCKNYSCHKQHRPDLKWEKNQPGGAGQFDDPIRVFIHNVFSLPLLMLYFYLEEWLCILSTALLMHLLIIMVCSPHAWEWLQGLPRLFSFLKAQRRKQRKREIKKLNQVFRMQSFVEFF